MLGLSLHPRSRLDPGRSGRRAQGHVGEQTGTRQPQDTRTAGLFLGRIDAYRFKLASGRDLRLNPAQAGPALNTFGYPYAEVDGKPLDFYDPKNFSYSFTYQEK